MMVYWRLLGGLEIAPLTLHSLPFFAGIYSGMMIIMSWYGELVTCVETICRSMYAVAIPFSHQFSCGRKTSFFLFVERIKGRNILFCRETFSQPIDPHENCGNN
jgi:hypothetical protein